MLALLGALILAAPALATDDVYLGQGTFSGSVYSGFPGSWDWGLKYTFSYEGPMVVRIQELPLRDDGCEAHFAGPSETHIDGSTLGEVTWIDHQTGESGQATGFFSATDWLMAGTCYFWSGAMSVGPARPIAWGVEHEVIYAGDEAVVNIHVLPDVNDFASVHFSGTREPPFVMRIAPTVLNQRSKGKWMNINVESRGAADVEDIDVSSLELAGIPIERAEIVGASLTGKVSRQQLGASIDPGMVRPVYLTGRMFDGSGLVLGDTIRVIDPQLSGRAVIETAYPARTTAMVEWPANHGEPETSYDGYISTDGGATWNPLFEGLKGVNEYSWALAGDLTGSAEVLIEAKAPQGVYHAMSQRFQIDGVEVQANQPGAVEYDLSASPNPFNPRTTVHYALPTAGHAELIIYDLAGRRVKTLVSGSVDEGQHEARWDGRDESGRRVASGVYLYRLVAGDFVETKRMVLLR